ncbi:transcriptional regulator, DeoR family [Enterococcus thailandicus]|nr:transcriptional regulator, DeoR family [Enterococcus thailandicus]
MFYYVVGKVVPMLKSERQRSILELCEQFGVITVKMIQKNLPVSDMTIRRDLDELAQQGKIERVHGGAQSKGYAESAITIREQPLTGVELSHTEKKAISIEEKKYIAKNAAKKISAGDTIFLGSGTTIELMTHFIQEGPLRIVTNSLPVFNLLEKKEDLELYLVGGSFRKKTGAFVGSMANETIQKLSIEKAFVGVNGILDEHVFTFSIEEGKFQQLVLEKAHKKYLVGDAHKFGHSDFYNFYSLTEINGFFTDYTISEEMKTQYEQYTQIFN